MGIHLVKPKTLGDDPKSFQSQPFFDDLGMVTMVAIWHGWHGVDQHPSGSALESPRSLMVNRDMMTSVTGRSNSFLGSVYEKWPSKTKGQLMSAVFAQTLQNKRPEDRVEFCELGHLDTEIELD